MGKGKSIHNIFRFWMEALVSSCHIARCAWHPTQATPTSAGAAWLQQAHSAGRAPANFPTGRIWASTVSHTAGQQLKPKAHLSQSLQTAASTTSSQNCPQCTPGLEWGTEITQMGSVFWHCIHIYSSASVNLLKEVKVLPRKLKADHAWTSTI